MKQASRYNFYKRIPHIFLSMLVLLVVTTSVRAKAMTIEREPETTNGVLVANSELTIEHILVSSSSGGNAGGVSFADEDILSFDMLSRTWSMLFDGSDVGLSGSGYRDVDAFHILDDGSLLLSLVGSTSVPDVGQVDDSDIIRFFPTSLGSTTAGTYELYFDGSDVELTTNGEDIDALTVLPDGDLVVSTSGGGSVTGVGFKDEDLLRFTPTRLGANTAGNWTLHFDGSDVGLSNSSSEDIWGLSSDGSSEMLYLTTGGAFSVTGVRGSGADVFHCLPDSLGVDSSCSFEMDWDGTSNGIGGEAVDGLTLQFSTVEPPSGSGFTDCVSMTGSNATIGIPADVTINGGFLFAPGDQLAVFTPDNVICAGLATWTGSNIALTVWGDDDQTGVLDGMLSGDKMMFRIWDQSSTSELSVSAALYSTGDGIYQPDSMHKVSSLTLSLP